MAINGKDKAHLLEIMQRVAEGDHSPLSEEDFDDQEIVTGFNKMLMNVNRRNTHYLMRINDSMQKIGNGLWLKKLFEIITEQQVTLEKLQQINKLYTDSVQEMDDTGIDTLSTIRQLHNSITPCVDAINEILIELEGVKNNALPAEEVFDKLRRLLGFNSRTMITMLAETDKTVENIYAIYRKIKDNSELATPLVEDVMNLADSCNRMSLGCFDAGRNMYEISRLVDEARNDMYRHNSAPSVHDSLEVFAADHIVVTWRMFNHIQEYEVLRRAQVDNPDRCKLGLWLRNKAPEWLRETDAYKALFDAHEELHVHLIACFDANGAFEMDVAKQELDKSLACLDILLNRLEDVHSVLRENGDYLETTHNFEDLM